MNTEKRVRLRLIGSALTMLVVGIFALVGALQSSATYDLLDSFDEPLTLEEAAAPSESASDDFWVSSGGAFISGGGVGKTMQGEAPPGNRWRFLYARNNPLDTDGGAHPQNTFRLITRNEWEDASAEVVFRIIRHNPSDSPNRDASNGVLFLGRYHDADNVYYGGVRDDGHVVIKKKIGGVYYTLAEAPHFEPTKIYDRATLPSLLPIGEWIGMRLIFQNQADGSVSITLFLDEENGSFDEVLHANDDGVGGAPLKRGHFGIRTDFKDVEFDSFSVLTLQSNMKKK